MNYKYDLSSPTLRETTLAWLVLGNTLQQVKEVHVEMKEFHHYNMDQALSTVYRNKNEGYFYSMKYNAVIRFKLVKNKLGTLTIRPSYFGVPTQDEIDNWPKIAKTVTAKF